MTRAELKSNAKQQIQGKLGILLLMVIINAGIVAACNLVPVIGSIASSIIAPSFVLSFCIIFLKLTKDEEISISDLFLGFSKLGTALWLNILTGFFTFLWSLLLVIPGIIKAYSYSMAFYILAENPELNASEALARSTRIMNGHKFDLFVLDLSFIGWYFLVGLTFGLAAIYVLPYRNATIANFYNSIKEA